VGTPGRVRLEVTDNTGRVIEVLEEATRSTGSFTYEWNTQQLAAGTYFCTLYVNDEPLVKKAVKLNER
ncbi:MAG: T9SS type A sorting domain-containing protein, partial [Flavobacteriales bacterium]|nr:T9SS type A sorting domain-containing protein [Flavobacteriales bacterium]